MEKSFEETYKIPLGQVENCETQIFNSPSKMWMTMVTERRQAREKGHHIMLLRGVWQPSHLDSGPSMRPGAHSG